MVDFGMQIAVIDIFDLGILGTVVDFGMVVVGLGMVADSAVAVAAFLQGTKSCVVMDFQWVTQTALSLR